jgi:hypothetical protein
VVDAELIERLAPDATVTQDLCAVFAVSSGELGSACAVGATVISLDPTTLEGMPLTKTRRTWPRGNLARQGLGRLAVYDPSDRLEALPSVVRAQRSQETVTFIGRRHGCLDRAPGRRLSTVDSNLVRLVHGQLRWQVT